MSASHQHMRDAWTVVGGRPDPVQLAGVLSPIIDEIDPDLIIVFGSAARAAMTAGSDVDLVVVKEVTSLEELGRRARKCLPRHHPPVDIVPATKQLLSNCRDSLSWVYGPAMADGLVAYERGRDCRQPGERVWQKLATQESEEERMVRILRYRREETLDWLDKARKDMTIVRSSDATIDPEARCYSAQAAAEKALKALVVAHGRPVRAEHDLRAFADQLRSLGETLPARATDEELSRLAEYGGPAQYPRWKGETTVADSVRFCEIAAQVYEHARQRAAEILRAEGPHVPRPARDPRATKDPGRD